MSAAYTTKRLDHLGLIAGFCEEIGLTAIIDRELGTSDRQKISFGQLFEAMILNGLGFTGRTLHMYSEYFDDKPLERLLGEGLESSYINDDSLGRCLDALYEKGVSQLYQQIAAKVTGHLGLSCEVINKDSSSFHYDGKGNSTEDDPDAIHITKGYSRDHRPDLNQVVLNLICENQAGIPIYMQGANGNTNDMEGFQKIVKAHIGSLKAAHQCRYLVADAALYVADTIKELAILLQLFITRVPQKLTESKALIQSASELTFETINDDYEGVWHDSEYADVKQKWLLIRSKHATKRERHLLDKRMLKQAEQSRKTFKKLCQKEFACAEDAKAAVKQWQEKQATVALEDIEIVSVPVYKGAGRPKAGETPVRQYYQIHGQLYTPLSKRKEELKQIGLFILATNDTSGDLTMAKMLSIYKSQQKVENGFRFLKSPDFLTSGFYLKKPERIEALLMVMTTCLMVYAALEHRIRKELKAQDEYFPDMKKKPTQNPTARWVFQCFAGVDVLTVNEAQTLILNIKDRQSVIIKILGPLYQKIYS